MIHDTLNICEESEQVDGDSSLPMVAQDDDRKNMKEIALHLLDLAENSISAHANAVRIDVREDFRVNQLTASVEDNGDGMTEEVVRQVVDPFYTSRTERKVGLGIPLFKASAEACHGAMKISSRPGSGTKVEATFQHSHIDRMPLGDLPSTVLALVLTHPEVHWVFQYTFNPPYKGSVRTFEFDDRPVKDVLQDVPLTHPDVITFIRSSLEEGIAQARK